MEPEQNGIPSHYLDKYGLIDLDQLEEIRVDWAGRPVSPSVSGGSLAFRIKNFKDNNLIAYPRKEAESVIEYLLEHRDEFPQASLKISPEYWRGGGAEIWGITFQKALEISREQKLVKSIYYALDEEVYREYGVVVYFVIRLNRLIIQETEPEYIQLEAWQGRSDFPNIFYLHAYFNDSFSHCTHLDGATIDINCENQAELYLHGIKVKGENKTKLFRLDGYIPISSFYEISEQFFPVTSLWKEYFGDSDKDYVVRGKRDDGTPIAITTPITPIDAPSWHTTGASVNSADLFLNIFRRQDS